MEEMDKNLFIFFLFNLHLLELMELPRFLYLIDF